MGVKFIKPEELGIEISKIVSEYTEDVSNAIAKEIDDTAKLVLKDVKANAPRKRPKYYQGFRIKKDDSLGSVSRTIHNSTHPGLVHLLEKGHGLKNGGRSDAKPHLAPAYDKHVPQMERKIESIIKKGGK